jgi:hypothetical protein
MGVVKHSVRVVDGGGYAVPVRRQPPLVVGYEHFRLDRQGQLLSPKTLIYYDETVLPFLRWLDAEGVRRFDEVDVGRVRTFRAHLAARVGKYAGRWRPRRSWSITEPSFASSAGLAGRATRSIHESSSSLRPACRTRSRRSITSPN